MIFLGGPPDLPEGSPAFHAAARSLAKPLNIERLEEIVRELLGITREAQAYKAERSR